MYQVSGYSMLSATVTTLVLSIIFLILSRQSDKNYMRLWGISWLIYSAIFSLDFLCLQNYISGIYYISLRQFIALIGCYVFLLGTHHFFQIKPPGYLRGITFLFALIILSYPVSDAIQTLAIIPNIMFCSGLLIYSGCMFISYSWTQNLPEKIFASFIIILWGIFISHFGFSLNYARMAVFTYFISVFIVNILIIFLIIIYFKKTRFLDNKQAKRFRLLVENSSDSMFLYDYKREEFEYVSPTISNLIGITDKQLYTMPACFFDFVDLPKKHNCIASIFTTAIDKPGSGILRLSKEGAAEKWSEIHYLPIFDTTGLVTEVEGILRDITERKRMEEDLEEVENTKKELLENISHEIKTPVMLIQGYTESLIDQVVPVQSTATYLKMIHAKAAILTALVDDLAHVSKLTSQNLEYHFYEKYASEVFEELIKEYEFQIIQTGHKARISSTLLLDAVIIIDPHRIHQVIANLINNSIRHTRPGKEISINCITLINDRLSRSVPEHDDNSIPAGELIFKVRDQGDGIAEENLSHIFERNFSEGRSQSGLGLFISNEIVKQHSGTMEAKNNPEGGAEVMFSIPFYT